MPSISPVKETNGPDTIRTVSPNLKIWGLVHRLPSPFFATLQLNSHLTPGITRRAHNLEITQALNEAR
ncbi:MAG TPA: hypothetical protein VFD48_07825 [Pyrinomonadaceae bacterium]|nr:hypothetical protein [Pyrinomonadaceae bacterium]